MNNNYAAIFRHAPYRNYWLGFTFSVLGDGLTRVALTWYVLERTQSSEALGLLTLCYTAPVVVGGLMAGALLDRFDRRKLMMWDNIVRGLAMTTLPLVHALGALTLAHVYVVAAIYGFLFMVGLAGGPAILPNLVDPERLATANALEVLGFTISGVLAPVLAGWLIGLIGAPYVILLDALTYFAFARVLSGLVLRAGAPSATAKPRATLADALRLMVQHKALLSTTLMFMALNIGGGALSVGLPIYVSQTLGGGAALYGLLLGAESVGEVASSMLVGALRGSVPLGLLICIAQVLSGLSIGLVLLSPTEAWTAAVLLAYGFCSAPLTIWAQTIRMGIIPAEMRGRTFALLRMIMQGGRPLGGALGGFAMPALGLNLVIALSALVMGVPGLMGVWVKELRVAGWVRA